MKKYCERLQYFFLRKLWNLQLKQDTAGCFSTTNNLSSITLGDDGHTIRAFSREPLFHDLTNCSVGVFAHLDVSLSGRSEGSPGQRSEEEGRSDASDYEKS